ncbi:putative mitochondrial DnaJ chaperone [Geopyxis carbonaria]|nr:putative mitochondrial DnaJ chaperone [Geopyxis carbonaria]
MSFVSSAFPRAVRALRPTVPQYRCLHHHSHRPTATNQEIDRPIAQQRRSFFASPNSQATKNPYSVLGVDKSASAAEIKKAYYAGAKKFHPDTSKEPNAREKFQEIGAAWEILSDPEKKQQFDQYGESAFDPSGGGFRPGAAGGFGGAGGFSGFGGGGFAGDFSFEDLFSAFGAGKPRPGKAQYSTAVGDDIQVQATISFMDAAKGSTIDIRTQPLVDCNTCTGTGVKKGMSKKECGRCGGTGHRISFMQGGFQMASTCDACDGNGVTIPRGSECQSCHGIGIIKDTKTVSVDIPAGIEDRMRIRVSGEGNAPFGSSVSPGQKKKRGDLHIFVHVAPHTQFGRNGSDILYTAPIPMTTALLGGIIRVPTLDGEVELRVPTGTNTGDKITMSGMGMFKVGSRRNKGDLKVEFKVHMPKSLTASQRTLLELLADEFKDNTAKRIMNVGQFAREAAQKKAAADSSSQGPPSSDNGGSDSKADGGILKGLWDKLTHHKDSDSGSGNPPDGSSKKASGSG